MKIHKRETRRQIYFPFFLGIVVFLALMLLVILPIDSELRFKAQAIADWMYTILCLFPLVICLFPVFVLVMLGIWGMNRLHAKTATPLQKLEILAQSFTERLNTASEYVTEKTISASASIEPVMQSIGAFDTLEEEIEEDSNDKHEQ